MPGTVHIQLSQADTPSGVNVLTKRTGSNRSRTAAAESHAAEVQAWPAPIPSRAELAAAFAKGLDLCEGKKPGHAARVCYIALNIAAAMELPAKDREALYFASLLHDAGAAVASAHLCRTLQISEESLFNAQPGIVPEEVALRVAPSNADQVVDMLHAHAEEGAEVSEALGFGDDVQEAIAAHHERWDGEGYPAELSEGQIPITGRLIAVADLIDSLISTDSNPLQSRRNLVTGLAEHAGKLIEPKLAQHAHELVRSDAFWLGLHHSTLAEELVESLCDEEADADRSPADVVTFAKVFAGLGDAKGEHTDGHSERTADVADQIALSAGLDESRRELLRVAALSHNVGLLGVPARVIAKPDILSLTEMETMRRHPTYSQMMLEALPGMEEIASWVGAHHERIDGKGYPEMLEADDIPPEARIISLADAYVALTSPRPYREALSEDDAKHVLEGAAGTQLDKELVKLFCSPTSSRNARRSRRTR